MISVCELFRSIQGESTYAGEVCAFVRLAGCNLDCAYCDTQYARTGGTMRHIDDIVDEVRAFNCLLVEVTGGEPLLQPKTPILCSRLLEEGFTVLVETNGSLDISMLPAACVRIVDVKCPGSGVHNGFRMENLAALHSHDQCKFVLSNKADFEWALAFVRKNQLDKTCTVLFSPVTGAVEIRSLAQWILDTNAPVRLGLQLHKIIWGPDAQGV